MQAPSDTTRPGHRFPGTTQQLACQFLRTRILSGHYSGGDRINPARVAEALGISRMPVREALRQLDAEGLVTIRPNRGAIVTVLTAADVRELFEIRAALEGMAGRLAAPHLSEDVLDDLEYRRIRMDRVRGDSREWLLRHDQFHDFLCRQARRPRLAAEIARHRAAVQPYLAMYISRHGSPEMQGYGHEAVIDALRSGSASRTERCLRDHIMRAARGVIDFLECIERQPGSPQEGLERERGARSDGALQRIEKGAASRLADTPDTGPGVRAR